MSVLSEPWMVLQDFHWHRFMFLAASDLRDYLGNNRSKENNGSIWWNYIFFTPFFSLSYCLCFLTNMAECLSLVHSGEGIITKSLNSLVLELSWRDINSGIIECTFYYALKYSCWHWLETFIFPKIHSTNVTATVSNCDISSFRMLIITKDKSLYLGVSTVFVFFLIWLCFSWK